jgi:hypothetical protein
MLAHRFWSFVGCHIEVFIILLFAFLCCEASHAYGKETDPMMAGFIAGARLKLMVCDVVKQCAVLKLTKCGHLFSQVLEEGQENHCLCRVADGLTATLVPGGIDPPTQVC